MSSIYKDKFKELLWKVPNLKPEEEEYIKAAFSKFERDGVTKQEAEKIFAELRKNKLDTIDDNQLAAVEAVIMDYINTNRGFFG